MTYLYYYYTHLQYKKILKIFTKSLKNYNNLVIAKWHIVMFRDAQTSRLIPLF